MTAPPATPRPPLLVRLARALGIRLAVYPLIAACVNAPALLLAPWHHLADLAVNFQAFFLAAALLSAMSFAALRRPRLTAAALAAALPPAALIIPYYVPQAARAGGGEALSLISANLFGDNADFDWFVRYALDKDPDVLLLQEYTAEADAQLSAALVDWPHRYTYVRPNHLGQAIYAKTPLFDTKTHLFVVPGFATLTAEIESGGRRIALINTHPVPPGSAEHSRARNTELAALPTLVTDMPTVLAGDLNTTMWSPHYRRLIRAGGLSDARRGFGIQPTWPVPMAPLLIPLDHVLLSKDFAVAAFERHFDRSDHAALYLRLDWVRPPSRSAL